ncbi:hypothetical protein [Pseudoalteromonas ulvae]|uniref:Uncharacterized protein n=1 Tax=Pseudoalteromonas ulvae TaxID=107327 RepID=A0A244CVJ2_PSEDV|nr:hypothetical protein [Pseudoalteromonas ulvae]OUL59269.1 hypothetical protein B1199_03090 [Pseudoalteromonas ulvae]
MQRTDLKLFKPQLISNDSFAGGHRTNNEVVSGRLNEVFKPISDVDHARSAFDMAKLYAAVSTDDASRLHDANVFISEQPADSLVNTLIIELPTLKDNHVLSDIKNQLKLSSTKFHGMAVSTAPSTLNTIAVDKTQAPLLPKAQKTVPKVGINAYSFTPTQGANHLPMRELSIKAQTSDLAFFSLPATDVFLDKPAYYSYGYLTSENSWLYLNPLDNPSDAAQVSVDVQTGTFNFALAKPLRAGSTFTWRYASALDYRYHAYAITSTLVLGSNEYIKPGTWRIKKAGESAVYTDNGRGIFTDSTGAVFAQGNYDTGEISPAGAFETTAPLADDLGCVVTVSTPENSAYPSKINFNLQTNSFAMSSLYLKLTTDTGAVFSAAADSAGNISHANVTGTVSSNGDVSLTILNNTKISRIDYDINELETIVIPSDWLGIDANTLPNNGVVNIISQYATVSVQHRERTEHSALTSGQTLAVLADANFVDVVDVNGASLYSPTDANYGYDKSTGTLTINAGISAFTAPFIVTAVQRELATVVDISNNTLTLLSDLTRTYPAGSVVSSVYVLGDLQALVKDERTLSAWQNDFAGTGAAASNSLNTQQYPIEVNNKGCIAQRWAIVFSSNTAFSIIGEDIGQIYYGDTLNDCVVMNPFVNQPYFIIRKQAFGAGLNPGECFLFETLTASKPFVATRATSPGHSIIEFDKSTLTFAGNKE